MKKMGWSYLAGWNITDFMCIILFCTFFIANAFKCDHITKYNSISKLLLNVLMFIKLLFYIRIFERFGFLIEMIHATVFDLIPFISCFITFLCFFSFSFICLNSEIDPDVDDAQYIGYTQKTILQAFRTSIGELGLPQYPTIMKQPDTFLRKMNIALIWTTWYTQTFVMIVVMLNFIIAVINATYERVSQD